MKKKEKLELDDLKVETFITALSEEEIAVIEVTGGGTYGPACGATSSFNCYAICKPEV